jgi:rare lipoprotein A
MLKPLVLLISCTVIIAACASKKSGVEQDRRVKASQRPYTVFGERYEPMRDHQGFVQSGIASWYGRDFHGKTTSNGERYDMHAMTAAHKTLPLGVFVKVRNRENGREATVRVNDRGPFVKGRIIDLSYAAAQKLGVDRAGTAPVRIEALGYGGDGRNGYRQPETYDTGTYTVQVGSFKKYGNAQRLSREMKVRYGFSDVRLTSVRGDFFYRVYAGKFSSLTSAEAAEEKFSDQGYPGSFAVALD